MSDFTLAKVIFERIVGLYAREHKIRKVGALDRIWVCTNVFRLT